ncbi:isopenicillin N synthase family oxygenase [Psychrosphaera sp. F3M07]|uniref:2-oxoglutarate-dependent ethylene/succinate-forming enzyme n=1 Tax=Psychrosphaera aquimarina TaxID=2044854 RepID=A0ABU3QXY8_9GAMM|nr:2OG-Fe(II) oxygenase family protein [Psychrosphaera aquimarina]MBU2918934.1 isopenicillin N synthase family oxygenase [Psychrosphaera sp. F3M07]MDU0111923.1 2OG-Fe(II) oxygenase family protein [Psychrosphaera aquimarina]
MMLSVVDYTAENAAQEFVTSLHNTGFGVLKNHPIQKELLESIYENWAGFFASDEKFDYKFNVETQDGFFPTTVSETAKGNNLKDIKEYFHYYPWGQVPAELKQQLSDYYEQANSLAATLLDWVEKHSPADVSEKFSIALSEMIAQSQRTLLRILHYPPITGDEEPGAIRAAAHGDINLLTILPAANASGLQVQLKDGTWYDVPGDFGCLIVNIGDMLQEASGGYYPSTIHRVINPEGQDKTKSRISLPLFLHPKAEVVLSERYTADSYLQERLRELGVK